ncbi:MAG TPA: AAA family ATPase [Solirubrobacteraceae bacterium]|nr:AAA family ATPase [Solirubrobacteraceae bacterium]
MPAPAPPHDAPPAQDGGVLPGIEAHPHASAVLGPALPPHGRPSHAYLFHGPAGTGKRTIARAFAAELLADGAADPQGVRARVARDAHPDLTWVAPSGAAEMLVSDVDEPVVAAASRTPFESTRRVFVVEGVDAMNDQAANRMLKTLEEPPAFVHLLLLTDRREDVLPTIASRCQHVRFDPLPSQQVAGRLEGVGGDRALACARLAAGNARLAALLAGERGGALRASAEDFVRSALAGTTAGRPWMGLLEVARAAGTAEAEREQERVAGELELLPSRERKRYERERVEASRRGERRVRTQTLDLALRLAELWLRDVLCVCEGAPELIFAVDRVAELEHDAGDRQAARLRAGIQLIGDSRLSLSLNVSEELALEALAYGLEALLAR